MYWTSRRKRAKSILNLKTLYKEYELQAKQAKKDQLNFLKAQKRLKNTNSFFFQYKTLTSKAHPFMFFSKP